MRPTPAGPSSPRRSAPRQRSSATTRAGSCTSSSTRPRCTRTRGRRKPGAVQGVVVSRMLRGTRRTIASLAQWAEESRMVGRELWEEVHRTRVVDGLSVSALARRFGLDRKTVRRCLSEQKWRPYRRTAKTDTRLAEHAGYLCARSPAVSYSARILYQELRADRGYTGSYETVKRFVRPLRRLQAQAEGTLTRFETPPGQQSQIDWGVGRRVAVRGGGVVGVPRCAALRDRRAGGLDVVRCRRPRGARGVRSARDALTKRASDLFQARDPREHVSARVGAGPAATVAHSVKAALDTPGEAEARRTRGRSRARWPPPRRRGRAACSRISPGPEHGWRGSATGATDAVLNLEAGQADVTRVRFALEGSRPFGLGGDALLTPTRRESSDGGAEQPREWPLD